MAEVLAVKTVSIDRYKKNDQYYETKYPLLIIFIIFRIYNVAVFYHFFRKADMILNFLIFKIIFRNRQKCHDQSHDKIFYRYYYLYKRDCIIYFKKIYILSKK